MCFYYQDASGIHVGSAELFKELTGAEWTETMHLSPEAVWEERPQHVERELMHFLLPSYQAYRKKHPPVCLNLGEGKGRHSVCAREPIPKGSVAVEYLGLWVGNRKTHSSYKWGPIDGAELRNYGGIVEDGFPNVGAFHLYEKEGIPLRVLFVALEDIPAGDMLTVNYGMNHSVKVFARKEYRLEQMLAFFQTHPIETCIKRIKELRSKSPRELGLKKTLELENLAAKLRYLFQTPSALLQLNFQEILPYLQQADFRYFVVNFPFSPNARQKEILSYLDLLPQVKHLIKVDLVAHLRVRIFFSVYVRGIIAGLSHEVCEKEAWVWNEMFDATASGDQVAASFTLERALQRAALIEASLQFAKEVRSPLIAWLQSLCDPPLPLAPTG